MQDLILTVAAQISQSSAWELAAVLLAIIYLILAVGEKIACWYAAFVSTLIFLVIFWKVKLYMESALQIYYLAMAIYGWHQWRQPKTESHYLPITRWSGRHHFVALAFIAITTLVSGYILHLHTDARLPWLDSFTTWASVVTTYMVTKKILENWLYWLVIDSVSIYLYVDRSLYFTALLFAIYIIIIGFGVYQWTRIYRAQFQTA